MELSELKLYQKIDSDADDDLTESLKLAAETYLLNAGIIKDYSNELYKLAIKILTTHWSENRCVETHKKSSLLEYGLPAIISQLKYCVVVL